MTKNVFIEPIVGTPTFNKQFEIVERKGIGHPDTICDLVMDKISVELCKLYLKETGTIQHHNMDKSMLVAGQTENKFGGGRVTKPMKFVLGDRATFRFNEKNFPIEDLAVKTARTWMEENLRYVKNEHVQYQLEIGTSSPELCSIFKKPESFVANDTSALVGYAPYTKTESIVLETERYINSKKFKNEFPESGEDVKVMGFRKNNDLELTIAMAFVDTYVNSEEHYFLRKNEMKQTIDEFHKDADFSKVNISINNLDSKNKGFEGLYLTVLGTSADNADSGQVGRGNMVNSVISPSRPAGAEATAGKNPASHIGKIYNAMSFKLAEQIQNDLPDTEVLVWMYNVIGKPVDEPQAIVVHPISKNKLDLNTLSDKINSIVEKNLSKMSEFCMDLALGKIKIA